MTLYELVNNTTIQGEINIVYFEGEQEKDSKALYCVEDLSMRLWHLPEGWEDLEVKYIFSDKYGRLHIEICAEEEEDYD